MPSKKQQKPAQAASTPTGRKNPDNVIFLKYRSDPKPSFRLKSGNAMTVLRDRLRTSMHDPDETSPIVVAAAKEGQASKDKRKQKDKEKDKGMVNIEIPFKNIEQVDVVSSNPAAPGKTIIIHTKKAVESVKGHVLSKAIVFYFSALSNKLLEGGRGGVEDYMMLWKSLEGRGVDIAIASSSSDTPPEEGETMDKADGDDDDDAGSNVDVIAIPTPTPTPSKRRKRSTPKTPKNKDVSPFEDPVSGPASTGTSLLEGEMEISSSQPRRRTHPSVQRILEEMSDLDDDEEVEEHITPPPRKKKKKTTAEVVRHVEAVKQRPEVRELNACLDAIKAQIVENWINSVKRAAGDRKHLHSKLWREVKRGLEKTNQESLIAAGRIKNNEAMFQLHSKQYRLVLTQGQEDLAYFVMRIKGAVKTVSDQRGRLVRFKSPFEKE